MNQSQALAPAPTEERVSAAPREHMEITRVFAVAFAVAGFFLSVLAGLLAFTVSAAAPVWITLPIFVSFGVAAIVGVSLVRALSGARKAIAAYIWEFQEDRETAREIERLRATQTTNVSVRGKSNVVSVNSAQRVEDIRLIPMNGGAPQTMRMLDGVDERDLIWACERFPIMGHTQRSLMAAELPSGARITTFADYDKLLSVFTKAGLIVDRRERSAGRLISNDPDVLKRRLGLSAGPQDTLEQSTRDITPAE